MFATLFIQYPFLWFVLFQHDSYNDWFCVWHNLQGKSAEELRRMFNIADQLSPEEEAQVREENRWAQQPES
jgi:hypothetical protein